MRGGMGGILFWWVGWSFVALVFCLFVFDVTRIVRWIGWMEDSS